MPSAPPPPDPACAALLDELRTLIARHARSDDTTAIDRVLLSAAGRPGEPEASTTGTVMAMIARGRKRLALGDTVHEYGPGQYLVASVDLPITGHYTHATDDEPALGFGLVLRPAAIATLLLDAEAARTAPRRKRPEPVALGLGVADAPPELLDAVVRMVRLLDAPEEDRAVLAPMIEREILWRLLSGPLGATMRQAATTDSSLVHVSRAVRRITEHPDRPFRVDELARSCGMSTSAFHRSFRAVTALGPVQFQKQIRLQRARLLLLSGVDDVSTVGYRVGYDSASQFSREYRRQFGAPPGQDARRLRALQGAAVA
ncbi:AraC family transcriptional regulator [Patulibacter americanus]|uniref:AraC family transcriptional regulator n=1 Tax=Patulibacter americanus TaxID=588672 RepID=UPI0003B4BD52|nr:AraC family transcriptional regulator [Patulibacter americanus]